MDPHVNIPWDLEEEILSRLPIQSLARFKTVCKRWNVLFDDRRFLKKRPQFIFLTKFKICSIDIVDHNNIDPKIELNELPSSHNPCQDSNLHYNFMITTCDDLLFCDYPSCMKKWPALWNPCLRQFKWIKYEAERFDVFGLGYDNSKPEKVYKILGFITSKGAAVYECPSREFKFIDTHDEDWAIFETAKRSHVSLNGNLYWIAYDRKTREYFIRSFDFSRDHFETCCLLPGEENGSCDELVLAVFIGDRFSLLKQCYVTREIEIWVTKKIDRDDEVVWVSLMILTASNLPRLFNKVYGISYFIYGKTLIMCCGDDETREPCIYVAREDLCNKIQIDSGIGWFSHCVYVPSLISVPLEFN